MYVGTHGMAHALHVVLEAAHRLREERNLLFVFVGEGARKEALQRQAAAWGLDNVQFIGQQPKARVPLFYAACDIGLVTLRRTPLFQEVLPSKIFEYLAMERPLLLGVDGEARELVEGAGAGRFVEPERPEALARAVRELAADRERLREMGRAGRAFVLARYRRSSLAERYAQVLDGVVASAAAQRRSRRRQARADAP
jgi:glycosyltransferase involved in cell wall biosynthesis